MKSLIAAAICLFAFAVAQNPPPPPFLVGAPENIIKEFNDLIQRDESKTDSQIEADLNAWVAKLGGDYKAKFEAFKNELKQHQAEFDKAHAAAVAKFSPAAKEADAKLSAIAADSKLNGIQKRKQIKAIFDGLPKQVREEIEKAAGGGK
ncbi:OV-17 antigen [Toxocara canis]|uniref:OV-17 antigen n=2 Tax=Toxocara canis TaxID=6265 RepID=A0A0B2VKQ1_TOXCA|nr:OV-17 antigen [Toxocara canis]VDM43260.1 unnamed protein product [Toxocara canis]